MLILASGLAVAAAATDSRKILVVGDSLSAGYGLPAAEGWVALLAARLRDQGYGYEVVNASITGDTTRGGLARLPATLERHQPAVVVIELGGNDGLRGIPIAELRSNLRAMISTAREAGAKVLLVSMRIPPNYGLEYARDFEETFALLAEETGINVAPFILADVALNDSLMQSDGIHPNARAQPVMLDSVWPSLRSLLVRPKCSRDGKKMLQNKAPET